MSKTKTNQSSSFLAQLDSIDSIDVNEIKNLSA